MSSQCRSCGAPVLWVETEKGKRMPLDQQPVLFPEPPGMFVLRAGRDGDSPRVVAVAVPAGAFEDEPNYRSHFATCPDAKGWRR